MRDVGKDKTHIIKKYLTYSWVFETWYEKVILMVLSTLGAIKLFELFL